jgi:cell division protein ZapD
LNAAGARRVKDMDVPNPNRRDTASIVELSTVPRLSSIQVTTMQNTIVTFEEPLNECMRICLRLEHLLDQATHYINGTSKHASRAALSGILEALNVLDRPDLKSKLAKALTQHANTLHQLKQKPHVDLQKLGKILHELEALSKDLYCPQDKTAQLLRGNSFLSNIRQHMANPGGACAFSTPAYHLWLQYPYLQRHEQLHEWFAEFGQIRKIINLLLKLTRGSTTPKRMIAQKGYYQQTLDSRLDYHLVCIHLPQSEKIYPEISVGKHRLNIRFMVLDTSNRSLQSNDDVAFELSCCLPLGSGPSKQDINEPNKNVEDGKEE